MVVVVVVGVMVVAAAAVATAFCIVVYAHIAYGSDIGNNKMRQDSSPTCILKTTHRLHRQN